MWGYFYLLHSKGYGTVIFYTCQSVRRGVAQLTSLWSLVLFWEEGVPPSPLASPVQSPVPSPVLGIPPTPVTRPVQSPVPGPVQGGTPWPGQGYPSTRTETPPSQGRGTPHPNQDCECLLRSRRTVRILRSVTHLDILFLKNFYQISKYILAQR